MLDLLKGTDDRLLFLFWAISISLVVISVVVCLILGLRRIYKNIKKNKRLTKQTKFESALNTALTADLKDINFKGRDFENLPVFNEVLLRYFRMLNGERAEALRMITEVQNFEPQLCASTKVGTVGRRMEAMQVLSYLKTQGSLLAIHDGLSSSKKYIRLTAARCLTRRSTDMFIDDIIYSINTAFPDDPQLLADILFRFGPSIAPKLESCVQSDSNASIKTAGLEALVLMMPAETTLRLDELLESSDERVRAAAVSLSAVTAHHSDIDILSTALTDTSTKVKIRAAKIAHKARRTDTISPLFKLAHDPLLWVRYWSIKAIWNTGRQGKKLVDTMGQGDSSSSRMAREVALECKTINIQATS